VSGVHQIMKNLNADFTARKQLRLFGVAGMAFLICRLAIAQPLSYDLVWGTVDPNGLPLNPAWGWQVTHPGQLPSEGTCLEPHALAGTGGAWLPSCTSQDTWIDANRGKCPTGELGGHANWAAVAYEGTLFWSHHVLPGGDDDYNVDLVRSDRAGLTDNNDPAEDPVLNSAQILHMEFDSDETIDHFHTSWWNDFHSAVDAPGSDPARTFIRQKRAIVIGLMGLDEGHSGGSELHPVFAMAIHVKADPSDDTWAIFVRNWGDEGYCSSGIEELPLTAISFLVPWKGASDFTVPQHELLSGPDDMTPGDKKQVSVSVALMPNEGALLTVTLPPARARARLNGVIHFAWSGGPGGPEPGDVPSSVLVAAAEAAARSQLVQTPASSPASAASMAKTKVPATTAQESEMQLAAKFAALTPSRRAAYYRTAPRKIMTLDSLSLTVKVAPARPRTVPAAELQGDITTLSKLPTASKVQHVRDPAQDAKRREANAALLRAVGMPVPQ
jgi:hypothetical protein